jgi:hypothetical protein
LLRGFGSRHFNERESTRATSLSIDNDRYGGNLPTVLSKRLPERILGCVVVQIAHVELRCHGQVSYKL